MNENKINRFADLYLFAYSSKSTMAIYYVAFVLVYLFLGKISMETDVVLEFRTAIEMIIACMLIGFGQGLIVPVERLNLIRSAAWLAWSSAVTIGFMLAFNWFDGFPPWCGIAFSIFMILAFAALLLGLLFDYRRETRRLNEHLKKYQENLQ